MLAPSIDRKAPGKRIGFLDLIHSDPRHAHAVIPVPIAVIVGGDGPTVLVTGGVHGDEYAGIGAARRLIAMVEPAAARAFGLPITLAGVGQEVMAGDVAARLYPMGDSSQPPQVLTFTRDAVVTSMVAHAEVRPGDFVYLTGTPVDVAQCLPPANG